MIRQVVTQTSLETSPDNVLEGKPEEPVVNVPVKQLLHIFDAILALKSDVDEILIVANRILPRHRVS